MNEVICGIGFGYFDAKPFVKRPRQWRLPRIDWEGITFVATIIATVVGGAAQVALIWLEHLDRIRR